MRLRRVFVGCCAVALCPGLLLPAPAASAGAGGAHDALTARKLHIGPPDLVSPPAGDHPEVYYGLPELSRDGRYVVYLTSMADSHDYPLPEGYVTWTDRVTGVTKTVPGVGGELPDGPSRGALISGDGRWILFTSDATNLVSDDDNQVSDAFLFDTVTEQIELISRESSGSPSLKPSSAGGISADGSIVAFTSGSSHIVDDDDNNDDDAFVLDRSTGEVTLVTRAPDGTPAARGGRARDLSPNGRFVVLQSASDDLVAGDTNHAEDVFLHDRKSGTTEIVSISSDGRQSKGVGTGGRVSANGRFVVFILILGWESPGQVAEAPRDTAIVRYHIYVRDRRTGTTTLVSNRHGTDLPADDDSYFPDISDHGRYISFYSEAYDIIRGRSHYFDMYVKDRHRDRTVIVTPRAKGEPGGDRSSRAGRISGDGSLIAFVSDGVWDPADNDPPDIWNDDDVYVAAVNLRPAGRLRP